MTYDIDARQNMSKNRNKYWIELKAMSSQIRTSTFSTNGGAVVVVVASNVVIFASTFAL